MGLILAFPGATRLARRLHIFRDEERSPPLHFRRCKPGVRYLTTESGENWTLPFPLGGSVRPRRRTYPNGPLFRGGGNRERGRETGGKSACMGKE